MVIFHFGVFATLAFFGSQTAAGPVDVQSPTATIQRQRMTTKDAFSKSGLEYQEWADKMVAEGKMWRPLSQSSNSTSIAGRDGDGWSLHNIACGYVTGLAQEYTDASARYCNDASLISDMTVKAYTEIFTALGCEPDNEECVAEVEVAFEVIGLIQQVAVQTWCTDVFKQVNTYCGGVVGGSGQLTVDTQNGPSTGTVSLQFFDDPDDTCPAPSPSATCQVSSL